MHMKTYLSLFFALFIASNGIQAQPLIDDKFRQLDEILPTTNQYRTASGSPGHKYWQQQVDYHIKVTLDDKKQILHGASNLKYQNNSPDTLSYLWIQLDQNRHVPDSTHITKREAPKKKVTFKSLRRHMAVQDFEGGVKLTALTDKAGNDLPYIINGTMLRVDLPQPLLPSQMAELNFKWHYPIPDQKVLGGRSGYEYFEEDENYLYQIAAWYPRAAAYYDAKGWQNKQFIGNGEFTLEFGNYHVEITVPADHVVAATGTLENADLVLTKKQLKRLAKAKNSDEPVLIITPDEALDNEESRSRKTKTWHFKADKVRDFAFASSRKFIWDAQGYQAGNTDTLAMSFYPNEGNPLWEQYSTPAIIHTIEQFNRYTFDYPYPVAISVNGPVYGMEYPMISFNGPRPTLDKKTGKKTYSRQTKYRLLDIIVHEIGHNYFPMIINSDERQWTWMDEGLNTFVQFVALQAWEDDYPQRFGHAANIVKYMKSDNQVPIMTNSESILQLGNNAYGKPATALNILRETIMGRELFDFAFKEYAQRWKFKRPTPADFFRTMEDASAMDLDWFWRGWFYTTDHVDIALGNIHLYRPNSLDPETEAAWLRALENEKPEFISNLRDQELTKRIEENDDLEDFYNEHDKFTPSNVDYNKYHAKLKKLEDWEKELLEDEHLFYILDFENLGGLVMPIILQITYADDSQERIYLPAEIWRKNSKQVSKLIISEEEISEVIIDPHWETADVNINNNYWPARPIKSRFELFKRKKKRNLMHDYNQPLKR